jgi:hypothetical protein
MNKFMTIIILLSLLSTSYILYKVDQIDTKVTPYSKENVERVREALNVPAYTPPIVKVYVPMDEVLCLQTNIYFESRNQKNMGKIGTAWVTLNRLSHSNFKNTICGVVYTAQLDERGNPVRRKCQFAWYCDGMSDEPPIDNPMERTAWESSGRLAYTMVRSCVMRVDAQDCPPDPTNGGLFFRSGNIKLDKNPYYAYTATIQDHTYYDIRGSE